MLTQDYRPQRFQDVLFQELPKRVLKKIAKEPIDKPRVILLAGPFGTGKTTLAKIFARALNCQSHTGDACMECVYCKENLETAGLFTEYDSAVIGNVATLRELTETFYFSTRDERRVILFDEAQVISSEAQSALLKPTEDIPRNVWFIFATTHPEDLLPALRSRSLELELSVAPPSVMRQRIEFLSKKTGVTVSDEDAQIIIDRAGGHFRNCDMTFDLFRILGDEFRSILNSAKGLMATFVDAAIIGNKEEAVTVLQELRKVPLSQVKSDMESFFVDLSKAVIDKADRKVYLSQLADRLGVKAFSLVKYYLSPWGLGSFRSDRTFEMFYWSLYTVIRNLGAK